MGKPGIQVVVFVAIPFSVAWLEDALPHLKYSQSFKTKKLSNREVSGKLYKLPR